MTAADDFQKTQAKCEACGTTAEISVTEVVVDGELRWDIGTSCAACGRESYASGRGRVPAEYRSLLYEQSGLWRISIPSDALSGAKVLLLLRNSGDLDIGTAKAQAALLRSEGLDGSRGEVELLRQGLEKLGAKPAVIRVR